MKWFKLISFILFIGIIFPVSAQSAPSIEVAFDQTGAQQGDTVFADVIVRNGENVASLGLEFSVDSTCLRILGYEDGDYMPGPNSGAMVMQDDTTEERLDLTFVSMSRDDTGQGDGVILRVPLEVVCEAGQGTINLERAYIDQLVILETGSASPRQFSTQDDALLVEVGTFEIAPGLGGNTTDAVAEAQPDTASEINPVMLTVTAVAQLDAAAQATQQAARQATQMAQDAPTQDPDVEPTAAPEIEVEPEDAPADNTVLIVVIVILAIVVVLLLFLLNLNNRNRKQKNQP